MRAWLNLAARFPYKVILAVVLSVPSWGAETHLPGCGDWREMFRLLKTATPHDMGLKRTFAEYRARFGQGFVDEIRALGLFGHWINGGAGDAVAEEDVIQNRVNVEEGYEFWHPGPEPHPDDPPLMPEAPPHTWPSFESRHAQWKLRMESFSRGTRLTAPGKITSIGVRLPSHLPEQTGNSLELSPGHLYLHGRLLEDIPASEVTKAKVITDVEGAFFYSRHPDKVLRQYLGWLEPGGSLYISSTAGFELNFGKVQVGSNEPINLVQWLSTIKGLDVVEVGKGSYRIRINPGETPQVPQLRMPDENYKVGTPPKRTLIQVP